MNVEINLFHLLCEERYTKETLIPAKNVHQDKIFNIKKETNDDDDEKD